MSANALIDVHAHFVTDEYVAAVVDAGIAQADDYCEFTWGRPHPTVPTPSPSA